jgi:ABC-type lipoprotein export system ATPase subunit
LKNGRGKTSLLSVMYGIRTDYNGEVFLDDSNIKSFTWRKWSALRKKRLSIIFQGLELFDDLSTLENIQLKNNITGHVSKERIEELARALEMEPYLHRKAGILSFGQQQRVAIIRALVQPFDFLLADECFSHMDKENTLKAYQLIQHECEVRNAGLVLTSLSKTELSGIDVKLKL